MTGSGSINAIDDMSELKCQQVDKKLSLLLLGNNTVLSI